MNLRGLIGVPLLVFLQVVVMCLTAKAEVTFNAENLPALPMSAERISVGVAEDTAIAVVDGRVFVLSPDHEAWTESDTLPAQPAAIASSREEAYCLGGRGDSAFSLRWDPQAKALLQKPLPSVPTDSVTLAAAVLETKIDATLFATDGETVWRLPAEASDWATLANSLPTSIDRPALVVLQGKLYLAGQGDAGGVLLRYDPLVESWDQLTGPTSWPGQPGGVASGLSHLLFFAQPEGEAETRVIAYHAITDAWIMMGRLPAELSAKPAIAEWDGKALVLSGESALLVAPSQLKTNYGWLDNVVVAGYLLGMIGVGWYFTKRESSSNDFFRGGQRIPWWAAGMSLFATGASAISLAGMPGMGFGTDWTYFVISICSAICLPIGIFVMAPLVRRLQISTSNEYLERRFGVTSRLFASTIFMFTQVAARIASVMLLSAIALEAITDMDITTAILVMGVVTTIYTYLGGLEAVIWTDTIQGFVMVATVVGCLILALVKLDVPVMDMWSQAQEYEKFNMFDFSNSLVGPTTFIFFFHTLFLTFGGISDQNFVQRVQSTPDLRQTKLAVATQMAVAVPINVLLFSLGTALWLFYRSSPESLSPTIVNNDGVFPFFAAQQLPIGVSGIVVAALLAATMSTVSSSICAVSDLGTNDFYRRFKVNATDHQCLVLGRILTAVVGAAGTAAAIVLASIEDVKSVWDLAIMVTGLISSSVIGLFLLGLVTRKTHEVGALVGAAAGMTAIILMKFYSPITFWLYIVIGPLVTIFVGVIASIILPGKARETRGLTLYSLRYAEGPGQPKATAVASTDA